MAAALTVLAALSTSTPQPGVGISLPAGKQKYRMRIELTTAGGATHSLVIPLEGEEREKGRELALSALADQHWSVAQVGDGGVSVYGFVRKDGSLDPVRGLIVTVELTRPQLTDISIPGVSTTPGVEEAEVRLVSRTVPKK
ncbi:MAG: hypothetical protein K2X82_06740 [Gemmataceae bacterium]|nr:hypothetical protein [Gemmataceae bacterium]